MKNTLRAGATLPELVLALSLCAILAAITIAGSASLRDRSSVRAASTELVSALSHISESLGSHINGTAEFRRLFLRTQRARSAVNRSTAQAAGAPPKMP